MDSSLCPAQDGLSFSTIDNSGYGCNWDCLVLASGCARLWLMS